MAMRGFLLFLLLSALGAAQNEQAWRRDLARPVPTARAVREVAAALFDGNVARRRAAASVFSLAHWPYLDRLAVEAFREERDSVALSAFFEGLASVRPTRALASALRARGGPKAGAWRHAVDTLAFRLAPRGLEGCRVWSAWPGSVRAREEGFTRDTSAMPLRGTHGKEIVLGWPAGAVGGRVLLGYRWDGEGALRGRLVAGGGSLGAMEFRPGPPTAGTARVAALSVAAAPPGGVVRLVFEAPPAERFWIQGLAVWVADGKTDHSASSLIFRPGSRGLAPGEGATLRRAGLPRIVIPGKAGVIRFRVPKTAGGARRHILIDHASKTPVTFDLVLDGRPLIRILSQNMPRGVRVARPGVLGPGDHVLRCVRIQGEAPLEVEALRLEP